MKIVFCGGGSGGHFYPIIAVAEALRDVIRENKLLQAQLYYFADEKYNPQMLFDNEIEFVKISAGKMRRYFSIMNIIDFVKTFYGFFETIIKMFIIFPDIIFSKGGFQSLPVVVAGKFFGIPVIIHESDSVPGRANVFAGKLAEKIALSFSEAGEYFDKSKVAVTGNPIRKEVLHPLKEGAFEFLNLKKDIPVILIMGGSLGSELINNIILDSLVTLLPKYQITHQTGKNNFKTITGQAGVILEQSEFKDRYHPYDYLSATALRMAAGVSTLIISRGGSTIFEIASWGIPSILIPITDSNGDHQRKNSYNYARFKGAVVVEENNLTTEVLISEIDILMSDQNKLESMKKGALSFAKTDAAYKIAGEIINIAVKHETD